MSFLDNSREENQLEDLRLKNSNKWERSSLEGFLGKQNNSTRREDIESIKLFLGALSLKETEKELKMSEVLLLNNQVWNEADAIERLKYFIEEMVRRKDPILLGIAKQA